MNEILYQQHQPCRACNKAVTPRSRREYFRRSLSPNSPANLWHSTRVRVARQASVRPLQVEATAVRLRATPGKPIKTQANSTSSWQRSCVAASWHVDILKHGDVVQTSLSSKLAQDAGCYWGGERAEGGWWRPFPMKPTQTNFSSPVNQRVLQIEALLSLFSHRFCLPNLTAINHIQMRFFSIQNNIKFHGCVLYYANDAWQ